MPTALTLLRLLSDGAVQSGTALGQAIGVSRAAVWKQLQQLQHYGVSCHAVPGLGYQLATPCHLIDESSLRLCSAVSGAKSRFFRGITAFSKRGV